MAKLILSFSELTGMYFPGCATPKDAVRLLRHSTNWRTKSVTVLERIEHRTYNHQWLAIKTFQGDC